jgi:hypothetical protein
VMQFSDYIVYVDESGDHELNHIDREFPVFALSFCIFQKKDYVETIVPQVQQFKFDYWGHDQIILHEREIRKEEGDFAFLRTNADLRQQFHARLGEIIKNTSMDIYAAVILKEKLKQAYADPFSPYDIALKLCMEYLLTFLLQQNEVGKRIHIIAESRGKKENDELELTFRRIIQNEEKWGWKQGDFSKINFDIRFSHKRINSSGMQIADLTARSIALSRLRPDQPNRAYDIIRDKVRYIKAFPQ